MSFELAPIEQYEKVAAAIAKSSFIPNEYRGKPGDILAAILAGYELGIGPMQALQSYSVIQGKPTLKAEVQVALVRKAGHSLTIVEETPTSVTVKGQRADNSDEMTFTYTKTMADQAGLTGKPNWKQYPEAMLWARAVTIVIRRLFADVLAGFSYTPDDMGDEHYVPENEVGEAVLELPAENTTVGVKVAEDRRLKPVEDLVADELNGTDVTNHYERIYQALNAIPYTDDPTRIRNHFKDQTMDVTEVWLRGLFQAMRDAGEWPDIGEGTLRSPQIDALHASLAKRGFGHVGDMKKAELVEFAASAYMAAKTQMQATGGYENGGDE